MPLTLDNDSEPEPDVAVVNGNIRDYADHHPSSAILIVEVADTVLAYDRMNKAAAYARNAIPEYWDLNLCATAVWRSTAGRATALTLNIPDSPWARPTVGETISPLAVPGLRTEIAALLP